MSLQPYHPECTQSRVMLEAKQGRACLVLGWRIITMRDPQEGEQGPTTLLTFKIQIPENCTKDIYR